MKINNLVFYIVFGVSIAAVLSAHLRNRELDAKNQKLDASLLKRFDLVRNSKVYKQNTTSDTDASPIGILIPATNSTDSSSEGSNTTPNPQTNSSGPLTSATDPDSDEDDNSSTDSNSTDSSNNSTNSSDPLSGSSDPSSGSSDPPSDPPSNPYIFDFFNPPKDSVSPGIDGYTVIANYYDFDQIGTDQFSMQLSYLGPCGLDPPHIHTKGDELALVLSGTLSAGFISKNGAPLRISVLVPGQMLIIQGGSMHWLANLDCEPAFYLSGFDSRKTLTMDIAQNFFLMPDDVVGPALGRLDNVELDAIRPHVPQNVTMGSDQCRIRCGLP